ncbi:MAG: chemotaxis protein CheA [Eubacteriales bacterium]
MAAGNDSILDMYLFETNTLLEQLDGIALAAETADTYTEDNIGEIFRIMHTIKGSSAMMEFSSLMTVAHRIEDLFFLIRDNSMDIISDEDRPALFDIMFQAIDFFRSEVELIENNQPTSENYGEFVDKIMSLLQKVKGGDSDDGPPDLAKSMEAVKNKESEASAEVEEETPAASEEAAPAATGELVEADQETHPFTAEEVDWSDGKYPYGMVVSFEEGCGMENLRSFMMVTALQDFCGDFIYSPERVDNDPSTSDIIADKGFLIRFESEANRASSIATITTTGSVEGYEFIEAPPAGQPAPAAPPPVATAAPKVEAKAAAPEKAKPAEKAPAKKAAPAAAAPQQQAGKESLISVNLSKLDQLMAVVGEIVITEAQVTSSPDLNGLRLDNFTKAARQLRKLTDDLQDVSMSLRMVPVSGTFQKMHRIVRDMNKKLGKQATLTLVGEDTEVDKTIVDNISDPIMHIVRNSMDHGIEKTAEARLANGKSEESEIILSAGHTGSEVIIEIKDDGGGVNTDYVLEKALRQGLANPEQEYSHREILNFLLMPGFSTNVEVTEFSGRGVGMDVVKKNVEDVGGTVTISSEFGVGMTTTLKIPLTMAIMDGMEVSVGDSYFTIPISNIRQSFKVNSDQVIYDATQGEMIKCMDKFYPVISVKHAYRMETGCDDLEEGIIIWVESGEVSYCLFVDELIGEHQVVVKPLPSYINSFNVKTYGITGCTILGDGNISIIIDVASLSNVGQSF